MKKSYKPDIFRFVIVSTTVVCFIIFYVWLKLRIDNTLKEIVQLNQWKDVLKNKNLNLQVELQELCAEDRIFEIASSELGMVKRPIPEERIIVNSDYLKSKISKYKEIYE